MSELAPLAVYVHWPYCARICPYCDFNVVRDRRQVEQAALADAIVRDLEGQARMIGPRRLSSIFLGGGTPSLMEPAWAARIVEAAGRLWPTQGDVEVTLEANPTDAEAGRFEAFAAAGVNRLSLGVQSLDDAQLSFLGRNHGAAEALRAVATAQAIFPRVSLDLIYALPGQQEAAWRAELTRASELGVEHISPYQLTFEAGTALDRRRRRGEVKKPMDDAAAALFEATQEVLQAQGFEAYEVSNHARGKAARSLHNLAYWRGWDYVGAGPGAHGRLTAEAGRLATQAQAKVADYIASVATEDVGFRDGETLSGHDVAVERLLLGLRSVDGVALEELSALPLDRDKAVRFASEGLILLVDGRMVATPQGRVVLDRLTLELAG